MQLVHRLPPSAALTLLYLCACALRMLISAPIVEPTVMGDELSYRAMAAAFYETGRFMPEVLPGVSLGFSNVLYQAFAAGGFAFADWSPAALQLNFFRGIQLVNALLISLTIVPVYILVRRFQSHAVALGVSALVAVMPFQSLSMLVMAENLYIPLFWSCAAALVFTALHPERPGLAALSGALLGLLFLCKPQAISVALAAGAALAILLALAPRFDDSRRRLLVTGMLVAASAALIQFAGNQLLQGQSAATVGAHYTTVMQAPSLAGMLHPGFFKMSAGHLAYVLILFGLPAILAAHRLWLAFAQQRRGEFVLIVVLGCLFAAAFAMTLVFTQTIAHIERYERLHGRYYAFIYPAFLILAAALPPGFARHPGIRISIVLALGLVALVALYTFVNFPTAAFGIDYANLDWLNLYDSSSSAFYSLLFLFAATLALCVWYAVRDLQFPRAAFFTFYAIYAVAASSGQRWNAAEHIAGFHDEYSAEREQIVSHLGDYSNKVVLVEDGILRRCNYVFWLPYQYQEVLQLAADQALPDRVYRPGTWLLIVGERPVRPGYTERHPYAAFTLYRY